MSADDRYVCIHGHFYQPPRENPWLDSVELQDSAYPYHDWNERITAECYAANALSRILDDQDRIVEIVNNYAKISFDFGPTLLAWLEAHAPEVYRAVLEADRESRETFSGHGSALALPYNHMILPLASRRDKQTQVLWGIRDFERRFGRAPEGMWLPETAVDLETLDVLALHGIRFTLLAPAQAKRVRAISGRSWQAASGEGIDPSRAYEARLPSGRRIQLFFYDGRVSHAVAFERLLDSGEAFARRLGGAFSDARTWPQLVHVATDGETYGHHHRFGDMALAFALRHLESNRPARLTNYGEYLERHPPRHVVEIVPDTSWSCAHGLERWRSDCGCSTGQHPGWKQAWRAPLREAFDWLRDELAPAFEEKARLYLKDPWAARNDYIDVVLDRSNQSVDRFLAAHALRPLAPEERIAVLKLLGLQRHAMLMYTSCGWFFDDLSGIEAVQVLQYAGRAVQLAEEVIGRPFEAPLLERLERARSNLPDGRTGRDVYVRFVRPAAADPLRVAAHYAIASLFPDDGETGRVYSYSVERQDYRTLETGQARLVVGRARVSFDLTGEAETVSFGVVHLGDQNLGAGVRRYADDSAYGRMVAELSEAFERADFPEVLGLLEKHFESPTYSLSSLFRDEQRRILERILESSLKDAYDDYRRLYERGEPMLRFLTSLRIPLPRALQAAAEVVVNGQLRVAFESEDLELDRIRRLLDKARLEGVPLDRQTLGFALTRTLERLAERWRAEAEALPLLERLDAGVRVARSLPFAISLWKPQNLYHEVLQQAHPVITEKAKAGGADAGLWLRRFVALGEGLRVRVPDAPESP